VDAGSCSTLVISGSRTAERQTQPETKKRQKTTKSRKGTQDASKLNVQILMPFHPTLNHDVHEHVEKTQPIP